MTRNLREKPKVADVPSPKCNEHIASRSVRAFQFSKLSIDSKRTSRFCLEVLTDVD